MNDWQSRIQMSRRDGFKAAGVILGLMAGCILIVWIIGRVLQKNAPAPRPLPPPAAQQKPAEPPKP